ncbi:MAG: hypothetical protein IJE91_03150, partial [Clostridia bacterium]|nr:hypothetical protein [Clostridia bacterium]
MRNKKPNFRVKHPYQNLINSIVMGLVLLLSAVLSVFVISGNKGTISFVDAYGGNGTEANPYLIYNCDDLENVSFYSRRSRVAGYGVDRRHFKIMADIDATRLNDVVEENFDGILHGNDKKVKTSEQLFKTISKDSRVENFILDASTRIDEETGYLAHVNYGTVIGIRLGSSEFAEKSVIVGDLNNQIRALNDEIDEINVKNGLVSSPVIIDSSSEETEKDSSNSDSNNNSTQLLSSNTDADNAKSETDNVVSVDFSDYSETFEWAVNTSQKSAEYFVNLSEEEVQKSKQEIVRKTKVGERSSDGNAVLVDECTVYLASSDAYYSLSNLKIEVGLNGFEQRINAIEDAMRVSTTDEQRLSLSSQMSQAKKDLAKFQDEYIDSNEDQGNSAIRSILEKNKKIQELSEEAQQYELSSCLVYYNAIGATIGQCQVGYVEQKETEEQNNSSSVLAKKDGVYAYQSKATSTSSTSDFGGLVKDNSGAVYQCANTNSTTKQTSSSGNMWVAGLVLRNYSGGSIKDCYNNSSISNSSSPYLGDCGGICMFNYSGGIIYRSINFGSVTARSASTYGSAGSGGSGGSGGLGRDQAGGGTQNSGEGGYGGSGGSGGGAGYSGGSAGGIAKDNEGTISYCYNYGKIQSGSG